MRSKFSKFIEKNVFASDKILLAISGGVDSVVMFHLFRGSEIDFAVAHCNYNLRGEDSSKDENFVATLCEKYNVEFYLKRFDAEEIFKSKKSTQLIARELRYAWFEEICENYDFTKIATAHHINDCIETTLLNFCRGTGIAGLQNMLKPSLNIIRPLLSARKDEIIEFAHKNQFAWREDYSNQKNDYTRNIIRNKVIPVLQSINPSLESTFINSFDRINQVQCLWIEHLEKLRCEIVFWEKEVCYIFFLKIKDESWGVLMLYEFVKIFNFSYAQIKDFLMKQHIAGAMLFSTTHMLLQDRDKWIINGIMHSDCCRDCIINEDTDCLQIGDIEFFIQTFDKSNYEISNVDHIASLDRDLLRFPLILRAWTKGDYFYPLGMQSKKKLSDFFIDKKISLIDKEKVKVLVSGDDIVWVVGYRIDDRYKTTSNTMCVYEIKTLDTNS